jgi:hypothetical protein
MRGMTQSTRYGLAILCVVTITVLLDWLCFADDEPHTIDDNLPLPTQAATELINKKSHDIKPDMLLPQKNNVPTISQLALVDITLPAPPPKHSPKVVAPPLNVIKHERSENQALVPVKATETKPSANKSIVKRPNLSTNAPTPASRNNQLDRLAQPSKIAIKQRLNQLVALKGSERSLLFPESTTKAILAYMHSCIGIDIGAVKDNKLTVFSHKNRRHSEILRVANGYRTVQEQALIDVYAPGQTLVRLYPISFDQSLGMSIARYLGSAPLTQLSGQYALRGNNLWLTKIMINQTNVSADWQLRKGC